MANRNPSPTTRFRKGTSGNPGGRPARKPFTEALLAELHRPAGGTDGPTKLEMVVARLVQMAMAGDIGAMKLIFAYVEGPPTVKIDVRGEVERLADEYGMPFDELYQRTLRVIERSRVN